MLHFHSKQVLNSAAHFSASLKCRAVQGLMKTVVLHVLDMLTSALNIFGFNHCDRRGSFMEVHAF